MLKFVIKNFVKDEAAEEFAKYSSMLAAKAREAEGNISYQICRNLNEPFNFAFFQEWENHDLLNQFVASDDFKVLSEKCAPLEYQASEFVFYDVIF